MGQTPCGPGWAAVAGGGGCGCRLVGWGFGDQTCAALETVLTLCALCPHKAKQTTEEMSGCIVLNSSLAVKRYGKVEQSR